MAILHPTGAEVRAMLAAKKTFLIDFYATWCGPCKMESYVLEDIAAIMGDRIDLVKLDVDQEPELTEEFKVNLIPGLLFIKDGEIASHYAGFLPKERLLARLEKLLGNEPPVEATPDEHYDLIIIGGGPAGLTAAIYARRAGLKTLVLESYAPGGKLIKTYSLENWPGLQAVNGSQLAYDIYTQAMALGTSYLYEIVENITLEGDLRRIHCASGKSFTAPAVIIATGTVERMLNVPGEADMIGHGISFCAVCDATFYRDKPVVIVGAGNAAFEEALYLTDFASEVTIVARRDQYRADQVVQDKVLAHPKIKVLPFWQPQEVLVQDEHVVGLRIQNNKTGEVQDLTAHGIFPYIGADPATAFAKDLGISNEQGYLIVKEDMSTVIPGIYGAGDCCDKILRQVVTAANDGAIATQSVIKYLRD